MDEPAVTHIHLWRFHQPLADIGSVRWKAMDEQQVRQQVYVARDRLRADAKACGKPGGIEKTALTVRQHRPQALQRLSRQAGPEQPDITLQITAARARRAACEHARSPGLRTTPARLAYVQARDRKTDVEGKKEAVSV